MLFKGDTTISTDALINSLSKITPIEKALADKIKDMREKLKALDVQDASKEDPNDK